MADILGIDVKPGDPIRAEDIMKLVAVVNGLLNIRAGDGIDVRQVGGRIHISATPPVNAYLAKATSDFLPMTGTARVPGTVDLYWDDGTNISSISESLDVVCVSTTAMTSGNSIDTGMWCWVTRDGFGTWFVAPLDCS